MPLPTDGTIHLMGHSRPGETLQSRPKRAMIIRMSDKTLDLLESLPQLQFEFSENPGLTIGDTFFPVTCVPEPSPHDLYLRTSSAAKRNGPLKLYANVTGKFTVERQLDDITEKVRASAADAQSQRAGRGIIVVDTPTDLPPPNGRRKKEAASSTMFRKPVRPADQPRRPPPASSAAASPGGASPAPPQPQRSKEALHALRSRMIRCIAADHRTSDQVVKLVGGNDCSASTKRDILDLLNEVAEPVPLPSSSKDPKTYRLKNKSWLEVHPYEIPGLSESERTAMARSAKLALRDLKIPESDPAWSHVQYRSPAGTTSTFLHTPYSTCSFAAGQTAEPLKRGITSTTTKKSTKPKGTGEITYKNESLSGNRNGDLARTLPPKPPASRPRPGSGFKAKQPTPTESREFASGRSPIINGKAVLGDPSNSTQDPRRAPAPSSSQVPDRRANGLPPQKIEKLRRDDVAASDSERSDRREREREREREDRERDKRDRLADRERERVRDREREKRDLERQRDRERLKRREAQLESDRERDRPRKKVRDREWSQEREEGERSDDSRPTKRKKIRDDDDYEASSRTAMKKRKVDSPPPPPRGSQLRDLSLPKKPDVDLPPRPKAINKESSPLPPHLPKIPKESSPLPRIKKESTLPPRVSAPPAKASLSASSSQISSSKPKTSIKRRRGSDIYTSSEDEGEIRPSVKREPASTSIPTTNNNHRNEMSSQSRTNASRIPPSHDRAALRAQYDTSYLPYLGNFQALMKHKTKICNMLRKMDKGSSGSVTESDGDGDLPDPEDLKKLAMEYYNQHEDLENIRRIFSKRD
ncbi:hypothetical protein AN958_03887 [Leucoagaricus sp. SymC.cos]|nr:hypothetical protein AN958_03887 [Leucoagaricus sp. SymC.cos]